MRGPWHVYLACAPDDPDPAGPLVLCEGETKADAIAEIGLTGASWRGGAEQAGKAIYERLQGRDVVLWPDSDAPGRKAGQAAAAALDGIAASIRIVDAPAVEGKNDAADYSPDERRALVDAAVPWEPTAESDNGPPPDCPRAVDAQWLIDNANDSLAALGSGFLVLGPAGLWTQYSDHAPGKQAPLGSLARRKALSAGLQPPTVSPRWYSTIRDGLHVGIVDKQIQRFQRRTADCGKDDCKPRSAACALNASENTPSQTRPTASSAAKRSENTEPGKAGAKRAQSAGE